MNPIEPNHAGQFGDRAALTVFDFENHVIRVFEQDGEPWLALPDVCRALDIADPSDVASRLDIDEKMTQGLTRSHSGQRGGAQSITLINESGLYSTIMTSRKPDAKRFRKWVTSEVLPSIRRTGSYTLSKPKAAKPVRQPAPTRITGALVGAVHRIMDRVLQACPQLDLSVRQSVMGQFTALIGVTLPLPAIESRLYTCTQLARMLDVTVASLSRDPRYQALKTPDHGINTLVHDAQGNPRPNWNWNEAGMDAVLAAFRPLVQASQPAVIQFDAPTIGEPADDQFDD
jgi:prophage antirepressor-like protein